MDGYTMPPGWRECPTPGKVKFMDEAGALRFIRRHRTRQRDLNRDDFNPGRLTAYGCRCGLWHTATTAHRHPFNPHPAEPDLCATCDYPHAIHVENGNPP